MALVSKKKKTHDIVLAQQFRSMISIMKEIDRLGCLLSTLPGTQLAPGRDPDPKRKKSNSWEKFLQQATLPDGKANRQVRGVSIIRAGPCLDWVRDQYLIL